MHPFCGVKPSLCQCVPFVSVSVAHMILMDLKLELKKCNSISIKHSVENFFYKSF